MAPQPRARRVGREKGPVVVSCGGLRAGPRQGSAGRPQFSLSASEPRQRGKRGTERPSNPEALHKVSLAPKFERQGGDTHSPGLHRASSGSAARPHSSPQGVPAERFWGDGLSRWASFLPRAAHPPLPVNRSSSQNHVPCFTSLQTPPQEASRACRGAHPGPDPGPCPQGPGSPHSKVPEARPLLQGPSRSSVTVNRVPGMLRPPWAPSGPLTSRLLGLCSVALSPPRRPGRTPPGPSPHRVSSFPAGQAFCPPEGTLGSRVSQCRGLAWGAERGETADGPCGVCRCQHPQLSCRAREVRPGDGLGRPGCGQPRATGRAGRKGKWTGGEGPRSCLPSARVGGGGGTLRGHSGTL